jgi:hypothetical protein
MASTGTSTRTRKAPADKVAVDLDATKAETPAPEKETVTYVAEAQGRGGKVNKRKVGTVAATHAVDVADEDAKSAAGKTGLIWTFHSSAEAAETQAAKYRAKGLDAIVVEATSSPVAAS